MATSCAHLCCHMHAWILCLLSLDVLCGRWVLVEFKTTWLRWHLYYDHGILNCAILLWLYVRRELDLGSGLVGSSLRMLFVCSVGHLSQEWWLWQSVAQCGGLYRCRLQHWTSNDPHGILYERRLSNIVCYRPLAYWGNHLCSWGLHLCSQVPRIILSWKVWHFWVISPDIPLLHSDCSIHAHLG